MVVVCRCLVFWSLLVAFGLPLRAASSTETHAFGAAAKAFQDRFYDRAEAEFGDFVQKFPTSAHRPEAILYQAEARLQLTNYSGALELLSTNLPAAGPLTDQYLFWVGEVNARSTNYPAAIEAFDRVVKEFPSSSRRLEALIAEANARTKLPTPEWAQVMELLQATNGAFQAAARATPTNELVVRGYLLLSESQFAQRNYSGVEAALAPLAKVTLKPELAWQRQFQLCRSLYASERVDAALVGSTNLVDLANAAHRRDLAAESFAFRAAIFERQGHIEQAIQAFEQNLAEGVPAPRQRQALLKCSELFLGQNKMAEAAQTLERFLQQYPAVEPADLGWVTLGELRLRQHATGATNLVAAVSTNAPAQTNFLHLAQTSFEAFFTNHFPPGPLTGKAHLGLGWCYWLEHRLPESQAAFQAAAEQLGPSVYLATALFKLADTQFLQTNYAGAIASYGALLDKCATITAVRTNLFEPALYQMVRAGLAANDIPTVTNALARILTAYPNGFHTDGAVLLTGLELKRQNPELARQLFVEFTKVVPQSPLRPLIDLATAATYEQQNQWPQAIAEYDAWLQTHTNEPARAQAEYSRAWATAQAGRETNALNLYTNFVVRFPTNELTPLAQWWIADHYYNAGDFISAERNFKFLFQGTNLPPSPLTYQARLMAGRSAFAQQGVGQAWEAAKSYFTRLAEDTNCEPEIRAQAFFAYGDTLISQDSTNKLADYKDAIDAFDYICKQFPTNRLAALACGEKAMCLLQWARNAQDYGFATNGFQQVIDSPLADATARSAAKVGLAITLEKMAQQTNTSLLELALNHHLDVLYGKPSVLHNGGSPSAFWTQKAGLEAARLAEALQQWPQAIHIYERLAELLPPLRAKMEEKMRKAQDAQKLRAEN